MALRRTLEMLKAGERINDLLYRSTLERIRRLPTPSSAFGPASVARGAGSGQGHRRGAPLTVMQVQLVR